MFSTNLRKTKWILFHSSKKDGITANDTPKLYISNFKIKKEILNNFLGIYIEKDLIQKFDIEHVSNKVSKSTGVMYKFKNVLNKQLMKNLMKIFSFVYSQLSYCNVSRTSTNISNLPSICRHQKDTMKIIYDHDHFPKSLLKLVKVFTINEINLFQIL